MPNNEMPIQMEHKIEILRMAIEVTDKASSSSPEIHFKNILRNYDVIVHKLCSSHNIGLRASSQKSPSGRP